MRERDKEETQGERKRERERKKERKKERNKEIYHTDTAVRVLASPVEWSPNICVCVCVCVCVCARACMYACMLKNEASSTACLSDLFTTWLYNHNISLENYRCTACPMQLYTDMSQLRVKDLIFLCEVFDS